MTRLTLALASLILITSNARAQQPRAGRFDGNWTTTLTCPPKSNTAGYSWVMPTVIQNNNLRTERGTAGEGGYLLIEGKIAEDGKAKLTANGIVASRKYARGVLAHKGADYSYNIKAQFQDNDGAGSRDEGLGIVGRPCTFDFARTQSPSSESSR